jgi:hypothetical protein
MISNLIEHFKRLRILKIYFFAIFIYALPLISLGIFIIDQLTLNETEMVFWVMFLVGMVPCGLIGLILSIIGLLKSLKNENKLNKIIGVIGTLGGLIYMVGGILGFMLIYVVVGE